MNKIAKLTVERIPMARLVPHERNPRLHPEQGSPEWATLKASLEADYFDPLVWNKRNGKLVSGHLRRKVMEVSGVIEADCVVVDWPEDKHLARMIAANWGMGEDDYDGLKILLEDLEAGGFDLKLTGLSEMEVERIGMIYDEDGENDPEAEWKGMPSFEQREIMDGPSVIVRFRSEQDRDAFSDFLGWKFSHKGKLYSTWWPKPDFDQLGKGLEMKSDAT